MKHEVRAIPPAPRRIRLRPLLAHRWPLLAGGGLLTIGGLLIAWLMFLQSGGKMSGGPRLDAGPTRRVSGTLATVATATRHLDGVERQAVEYTYRGNLGEHSVPLTNRCFVPAGSWRSGDTVEVEYLADDPNVSRIVGGILHLDGAWLRAWFWIRGLVLPGGALLAAWLLGALRLRAVLVHGDVAVGAVHRVTPVRWLLPEMVAVDYTFRDHHATWRHNRHWVRVHGTLGSRLRSQMRSGDYEEMPVLHDRSRPRHNRMVLPEDFLAMEPIELLGSELP
ncbi:MAG: hypothetical protein JNK15_00115 [Planctomycetes bacterium]|nr:hypothetical protein [Planctomycetota bacterium]